MPMCDGILPLLCTHQIPFQQNIVPPFDDRSKNVFSDGSAFWQDQPTCTIAGAAVITTTAQGVLDEIIAAQPMAGVDHNSYRAETFGLLLALQKVYKLCIYCDCQSTVDQLLTLIHLREQELPPVFTDHQDLWRLIWDQLCARPKSFVFIVKTKAHCNPDDIECPHLKWQALSNNLVDIIAKRAVQDWEPIFSAASRMYAEIRKDKEKHAKLCDIVIKQSETNLEKKKEEQRPIIESSFQSLIPAKDLCRPFPRPNNVVACKFGDLFLERVIDWASKLLWPVQPHGCVSLLELYIDFTIYTGTQVPVPVTKLKDRSVGSYQLRDQSPDAKIITPTLGEQSVIWARFIKWVRLSGIKLWQAETLSPSSCLNHVGYSLRAVAVANRPILVTEDRPMICLQKIFHTPTGKLRTLNVPYHGVS